MVRLCSTEVCIDILADNTVAQLSYGLFRVSVFLWLVGCIVLRIS